MIGASSQAAVRLALLRFIQAEPTGDFGDRGAGRIGNSVADPAGERRFDCLDHSFGCIIPRAFPRRLLLVG